MKKIMNQKLTVIFTLAGVLLLFFVMWFVIYFPKVKKNKVIEKEIVQLTSKLNQIEKIVSQEEILSGLGVQRLNSEFKSIVSRFAVKEEESIGVISNVARKHTLTVLNRNVSEKIKLLDSTGKIVIIDGKECSVVTVDFSIQGGFNNFVSFIRELREEVPAYLLINNYNIVRKASTATSLSINFKIQIFLIG